MTLARNKKGDRHLFHCHLFHNSTKTTPYPSLCPRNHARRPLKGANHLRNAPERPRSRHFNPRSHSNIDSSGQVKWFWRGVHTSARHNECAQNDASANRVAVRKTKNSIRKCPLDRRLPGFHQGLVHLAERLAAEEAVVRRHGRGMHPGDDHMLAGVDQLHLLLCGTAPQHAE